MKKRSWLLRLLTVLTFVATVLATVLRGTSVVASRKLCAAQKFRSMLTSQLPSSAFLSTLLRNLSVSHSSLGDDPSGEPLHVDHFFEWSPKNNSTGGSPASINTQLL